MHHVAIEQDSISREIFEMYYKQIEKIKIEIDNSNRVEKVEIYNSIDLLEVLVSAVERNVLDIATDLNFGVSEINIVIDNILNYLTSWFFVLETEVQVLTISALSYNTYTMLVVVENYLNTALEDLLRYIKKLSFYYDERKGLIVDALAKMTSYFENHISYYSLHDNSSLITRLYDYMKTSSNSANFDSGNYKSWSFLKLNERFFGDVFKIGELSSVVDINDISKTRTLAKEKKIFHLLEDLFVFNDEIEDAVWSVDIIISNDKNIYKSSEIGYLMWSFTKALESIEDIEVELTNLSEGSKRFSLKIRIKSLASKVDVMQLFKKTVQITEAFYTRRPIEEIEKFDAEKDKLKAEAKKIEVETKNIISEESSNFLQDLLIREKLVDIQKKEVEIESLKADVVQKRLDSLKQMSELMKDGIVQNNSDVQIFINQTLLLNKKDRNVEFGQIDFLDIQEKTEPKKIVS